MSEYFENKDLIDQCINGHAGAQYELYNKYSKAMFSICCRMMRDTSEAEDMLQTSFMDVFRNLDKYRYESTLGSWIKRIVINNCVSELKRRRIYFQEIEENHQERHDSEEVLDCVLSVDMVKSAIKKLPVGYRTVFSLYLLEGYDHREIGQILSISEATSKSQYSRAKKKMRDLLTEKIA